MINWKIVEIPPKMKALQKDKRGYPIPFVVERFANGVPNFRFYDEDRLKIAAVERLCSICGQPLNVDIWFVGGIKTANSPSGGYIEPPVHLDCGTYALKVCPYLAFSSFKKRERSEIDDPFVKLLAGKPSVFAMVHTLKYEIYNISANKNIIVPERPFLDIQYWIEGVQIAEHVANAIYSQGNTN